MQLIYKHGKERHFKINRYPDGQQNVELDMNYFNNVKEPVTIKASIRNWMELEVFRCLCLALMKNDFTIAQIDYIYLMGMRSDRSFSVGEPNYFRDVMAPMVTTTKANIRVLFPHSKLSYMALNCPELITIATPDDNGYQGYSGYYRMGADESACWHLQDFFPFPHFQKRRNKNGNIDIKLTDEIYSQLSNLEEYIPILIMDDLCDGGATFIAIAEYLEKNFPKLKRHLFIAHGLFTKGVDHVASHFHKVITTNSYQDFEPHEKLTVIDAWN